MKIGFTGTQKGMTPEQRRTFEGFVDPNEGTDFMAEFKPEFHSGDCVGADEQARDICEYHGYRLIGHPPDNPSKRAFGAFHEIREPLPYLDRNKAIVNETDYLIACPGEMQEKLRSGTWSTVRYARKQGRKVVIIYPNGEIG